MKSTLSITLGSTQPFHAFRTIEVPCRLPEAFNFTFTADGTKFGAAAYLSGIDSPKDATVGDVETNDAHSDVAKVRAEAILATIKATLGITGPVPPGSPLPAIALAYEAEVAAYDACVKVHAELPRDLHSPARLPSHPSERTYFGGAVTMLADYVEYVVEQAEKVTP